jgi:hypothetical protein
MGVLDVQVSMQEGSIKCTRISSELLEEINSYYPEAMRKSRSTYKGDALKGFEKFLSDLESLTAE